MSGRRFSSVSRMAAVCQRRGPHRFLSSAEPPKPKPGWNDPGTLSIWIGWSIVALICVDQGLQYQQSKSLQKFIKDVKAYRDPLDDADHYEWMAKPTLYTRTIRRVPEMDGYKCLHNVKAGDVVEVVEEKAGPDDVYSVCRIEGENGEISVGWFPAVDLEEVSVVEKATPKKQWYKFWS